MNFYKKYREQQRIKKFVLDLTSNQHVLDRILDGKPLLTEEQIEARKNKWKTFRKDFNNSFKYAFILSWFFFAVTSLTIFPFVDGNSKLLGQFLCSVLLGFIGFMTIDGRHYLRRAGFIK